MEQPERTAFKIVFSVFGIVLFGLITYTVLVGSRVVCEDFGALEDDVITVRNGSAYIKDTDILFSGVVHESGCGRECEIILLCPNPLAVITYENGKVVNYVKRW